MDVKSPTGWASNLRSRGGGFVSQLRSGCVTTYSHSCVSVTERCNLVYRCQWPATFFRWSDRLQAQHLGNGDQQRCLWSPYAIGQTIIFLLCGFFFLWPPCVIGGAIIFLPCSFFLLLSSSSFFPRLISAAVDWMSAILLHMAWP